MMGNLMSYTEPLKYRLTLLKPTYKEMSVLQEAYNIEYKGSLRDMNELSFSLPYYINEEINPNFNKVKNGYLIEVELYSEENDTVFLKEHFLIDRIENNANDKEAKHVSCLGLEQQLSKKLLKNFTGVKKLYRTPVEIAGYIYTEQYPTLQDFINSGVLNVITNLCPSWSVGEIDDDINELYRDIMVDSDSVLSFLRNTVQTSFSCLFYFDSIKKEINVRNLTQLGTNRGFFISENNYIKSIKETIDDSDIVTKLNIFGKDEQSIRSVNPTGETYILDLSYYRNTDYMSQSLLDALNHYDTLMANKSDAFQNLLTELNAYTTQLNTKNSELTTLKGDLEALKTQKDGLIVAESDLGPINTLIGEKETDITNIESEIDSLQTNIDQVTQQIEDLQTAILIENNFTSEQIEELDYYIKEKTVRDNTFTDAKELYDEGKAIIKRLSQPSVQFDIDIVDLFDLVECQHDWHKLTLGDIGTIKFEKFNRDVELRLIEYTHNFENNKLSLTFGNRKNLNDPNMLIDDLKSSVSSAVSLDINKYKYLDYINSGDKTAIYQYINGLLDLGAQGAVAGSNQEVKIDARGITLTNPLQPQNQMRLMADGIYFTDDNWDGCEIALNTSKGIAAKLINGLLGNLCELRADKIIVGDGGKIKDGVISSADNWNNAEQNAKNYVDTIKQDLKDQIDGKIETYFQSENPNTWIVGDRTKHNGDMWYNTATKELKRYNATNNAWELIQDQKALDAYSNASQAQYTADGKRRVFTTTPIPPYDIGDLWSGGANGDIRRCKTEKTKEENYSSSDWELASKYTDDTVANDALNKANNSIQQDNTYNGVTIDAENGVVVSTTSGNVKTTLNASSGIKIEKYENAQWNNKFFVDVNGDLTTHDLIAKNITIDGGTLKTGSEMLISLSDKTLYLDNWTMNGSVKAEHIDLKGINVGNGKFKVNTDGSVEVNGKITMGAGSSISWGDVTAPSYDNITGAKPPSYANYFGSSDARGAMRSTYLDGNNIWTFNVYAENIYGTYITGKTIRTASSGDRIELKSSGFKCYNNSDQYNGWVLDSGNFSYLKVYYNNSERGHIAQVAGDFCFTGKDAQVILESKNSNLKIRAGTGCNNGYGDVLFYGNVNFDNATVKGITAVFG